MNKRHAMLGLLTETSLHAGAGTTTGTIDLPIQREAHTHWPVVYGSAVKGAMRSEAVLNDYAWTHAVFGPPTNRASEHAGALLVGDARLLLLPVRSLTTHFKWVTSPDLLRRFSADCRRLKLPVPDPLPPPPGRGKALVAQEHKNDLFLEEFRFDCQKTPLDKVIDGLVPLMGGRTDARDALKRQLVIINDDLFRHLAAFATPVAAHVALEPETKTVKRGQLWYEESLPPDTLLYTCLSAWDARNGVSGTKDNTLSADQVLAHVTDDLFAEPYLQLGGNETTGMGWCRVSTIRQGG